MRGQDVFSDLLELDDSISHPHHVILQCWVAPHKLADGKRLHLTAIAHPLQHFISTLVSPDRESITEVCAGRGCHHTRETDDRSNERLHEPSKHGLIHDQMSPTLYNAAGTFAREMVF